MRKRNVVCALVVDESGFEPGTFPPRRVQRILEVCNPRWEDRFAVPTREVDPDADALGPAAVAAVRADTGQELPDATFVPLGYLTTVGPSGSTGEDTEYRYWVFRVYPGESFALPPGRARLIPPDELRAAADNTWTGRYVVEMLFQNQQAVLGVVTRPGRAETEYLVLFNTNYEGFFFPARRLADEAGPEAAARALVRAELGYHGPVAAELRGEMPAFQFSPRWEYARAYRFHVVELSFPPRDGEVFDLYRPLGPMERLLRAAEPQAEGMPAGWSWRWLTAGELRNPPPGVQFTQTMPAVVPAVLAAVPPGPSRLRESEGAIAFIRGTDRLGRTGWLAQWNEGWGAFFLIGGHRGDEGDPGETFAACVDREVREELALPKSGPAGFAVGAELPGLRYVAWSRRAGCYTDYAMHAFDVTLSPERQAAVNAAERGLRLRWLTDDEVRAEQTTDGRRVSETVRVLLTLAGRLT